MCDFIRTIYRDCWCRLSVDANCISKMERILTEKLAFQHLSIYGAIIVMFTYTILLDRDFVCTCKPQVFDCNLYMALPVVMIFVLVLWMDKSLHRVCRYTCSGSRHQCRFWNCLTRQILQCLCVATLWAAFVLLDGDWYVCCQNDRSKQQAHLACKDKKNITEADRVLIAELKNHSRVIGSFLLFGLICLAALVSVISWSKCCRKDLYYKVILEEEENVLNEALRKSAKTKLNKEVNKKISAELWEDCLDFANDLIKSEAAAVRDNEATAGTEAAERAAKAAEEAEAAARAAERAAGPAATDPDLQEQEENEDQGADTEGPQGIKMQNFPHPSATEQITESTALVRE
ncbi:uncharacterized protein LOC113145872 isoform X2 [Mastacembelus armatus]|uniref:uncharacterized protein LOC113145872 isoform X2 n=1 Tax=Mastacembelus armatus TaxID=205130 RepID=UPI000E461ACA|nr:uncharacterized protein LOC113145872 isoform X2 [Mastacembelus armatus]